MPALHRISWLADRRLHVIAFLLKTNYHIVLPYCAFMMPIRLSSTYGFAALSLLAADPTTGCRFVPEHKDDLPPVQFTP
jgi:hypothetical protein